MKIRKILSAMLILVLALMLSGCKSGDYKKAVELAAGGDYAAAAAAFAELGDYKDSAEQLLGCNYQIALKALADGDLKTAKDMFTTLGSYEDSAEKIKECDYQAAQKLLDAEDYEGAQKAFEALGDFKDSADKGKECGYSQAEKLLEAEDYEAAQKAFEALGDYKDSADKAAEAGNSMLTQYLVGEWKSDSVDYLDEFMTGFTSGMSAEEAAYFEFDSMNVIFNMTVMEDGTFLMEFDEDSMHKTYEGIVNGLKGGMAKYMENLLTKQLAAEGMTLEQAMASVGAADIKGLVKAISGQDLDEMVDQQFSEESFMKMAKDFNSDGTYSIENGSAVFKNSAGGKLSYDPDAKTISGTSDMNSEIIVTFKKVQ